MNTRLEVQAIIVKNKQVLVVQKNDIWRLPKGGIQNSETPKEALARELQEEVGLHDIASTVQLHNYHFDTPGVRHEVTVFIVTTQQDVIRVDNIELHHAEWTTPDDALLKLHLKEEKDSMQKYLSVKGV